MKLLNSIIQVGRVAIAIDFMSSDRKSHFVLIENHIAVAENDGLSPVGIWIEVSSFHCFTRIH